MDCTISTRGGMSPMWESGKPHPPPPPPGQESGGLRVGGRKSGDGGRVQMGVSFVQDSDRSPNWFSQESGSKK